MHLIHEFEAGEAALRILTAVYFIMLFFQPTIQK